MAILGPLLMKIALARFCGTLAQLLDCGIPIRDAVEMAGKASGSIVCIKKCEEIKGSLILGVCLSEAMKESGFFPKSIISMTYCGEDAGNVPKLLSKTAEMLESDVDDALLIFCDTIGPFLISVLGVIVGLLAIAVFYPLSQLLSTMGGV